MSSCFFDWQVKEAEICEHSQSPQPVNRCCTSNLNPGWLNDFISFAFFGAIVGVILGLIDGHWRWAILEDISALHRVVFICFGVILIFGAHLIGEMFFVGLTSFQRNSDDDREWLGRAGGFALLFCFFWSALSAISLLSPYLVLKLHSYGAENSTVKFLVSNMNSIFLAGGIISGLVSAMLGRSSESRASAPERESLKSKLIIQSTASVFIFVLLIMLSVVIVKGLYEVSTFVNASHPCASDESAYDWLFHFSCDPSIFIRLVVLVISFGIFSGIVGRVVNVNRFSLHSMYRNRLVRAFLGASNKDSKAQNKFTWFDAQDNVNLVDIWRSRHDRIHENEKRAEAPYLVVNAALNVVASENLKCRKERRSHLSFPRYFVEHRIWEFIAVQVNMLGAAFQ